MDLEKAQEEYEELVREKEEKEKEALYKAYKKGNGHCRRSLISSKVRQIYDQIGRSRVKKWEVQKVVSYGAVVAPFFSR